MLVVLESVADVDGLGLVSPTAAYEPIGFPSIAVARKSPALRLNAMNDDRIWAVLSPPQLTRFRELCHVADENLEVIFTGWSKRVVLDSDRAFLFPRDSSRVAAIQREASTLKALGGLGLPWVPRVVGYWTDPAISEFPFVATNRLHGDSLQAILPTLSLAELISFFDGLGTLLGGLHSLSDGSLLPAVDARPFDGVLGELTQEASLEAGIAHAERMLAGQISGLSLRRWEAGWRDLARLNPVLVYGDVCENQFLVDKDMQITGVLDWATAGTGHPLVDFQFGEWDHTIFEWELHFAEPRSHLLKAYGEKRGLGLDPNALHALFTVAETCTISEQVAEGRKLDSWETLRFERLLANLSALHHAGDPSGE